MIPLFEIEKKYKSANVSRTIRFTEDIFERLNKTAYENEISFNLLVLQCCRYALDNMVPPDSDKHWSVSPCRHFAAFSKRSRSKRTLFALRSHTALCRTRHNHITRSGAKKPQNKTASLPPTHAGGKFHSCETVLRGAGKSESPRFWFFWLQKNIPRSFPNKVPIAQWHNFKKSRRFAHFGSFDSKRT